MISPRRWLRAHTSLNTRRRIALARIELRRPTHALRLLPDFLVLGGQRCGTSSLFQYLARHPWVGRPLRKETEYFSVRHRMGLDWYRAHFPLAVRRRLARLAGRDLHTFEATPDYLFHPLAAPRAAEQLPGARLVTLLRDPVERAWSHYRHIVRLGAEPLDFESALDAEEERLAGEMERIQTDLQHRAVPFLLHSYRARGHYAEHLEAWLEHYPRERLLVVRSEDLFADTPGHYRRILEFLGLPPILPPEFRNFSYARPKERRDSEMPEGARRRLEAHFAPHNRRLAALLGREMGWSS